MKQSATNPSVKGQDNGGFKLANQPETSTSKVGSPLPATLPAQPTTEASAEDPLPRTYGFETLFLIAQDPHWLFTYWDIDITRHPGGQTLLRCYKAEQTIEKEIEVPFETRNWYIPVSQAGAKYRVELGYYRGETWNLIATSDSVETPPDNLSESDRFDFATLPLHLSFAKLMDNIQQNIQAGENLISALSRIQVHVPTASFTAEDFGKLKGDQRQALDSLLGTEFIDSFVGSGHSSSMSSHDLQELIRRRLEERLNSEAGSEWLSSWSGTQAESSLFGFLKTLSVPSSWSTAALSSWTATALMSWAAAARVGLSSWGPESLTSWLKAAAAQSPQTGGASDTFSSWMEEARSIGLTSHGNWNTSAGSSLHSAPLSSWNLSNLSSWSETALSSWTAAVASSWGSSGSSSWSEHMAGRDFFMHVNAELIFYGGTHPKASVTIDGTPITLAPDGSFRYHFVFPNGNYEVPIVATSPDGVETRSATLRFDRKTQKLGIVTDTPQPPLAEPIGKH